MKILLILLLLITTPTLAQEFHYKGKAEATMKFGQEVKSQNKDAQEKVRQILPERYEDIASLIDEKRYSEAQVLCKRKMSLDPRDYMAITQLGEIYWIRNKKGAATKLFKKAVELAPDYADTHFLLGRAYFFQRKHDKAIEEFKIFKEKMDSLTDMDEDVIDYYVSTLHGISLLYSSLKKYDMIAKECERIIKLKPDDQLAHYNLAVCYYMHYHNRSRVYNELQKVIEIDYLTSIADRAKFFIDYMRRNPDSRFISDFSFMFEDD